MGKLITLILLVLLGVYLYRRMTRKRDAAAAADAREVPAAEDMVRCKTCGVNLPRSEAILSAGRFYCCDEHRRADS
ncbi:MAG: hypothetical protein FD187_1350 [bacterium]|nr:MAG: hypothetical protein FD142_1544 [bacterium]KAF0149211.1 MAG: hypothetical protein FD187_1350 [bacterium]KAF0168848.1 MAG: hypothetical protein FD158_970 [bacterium]TXT20872.1 MAG: hypothetical protein FD132_930 [bacterium]